MKIVILGAGKVGYELAKVLSLEKNDVSLVDSSLDVLNIASNKLDVKTVYGHAADINILKEADIEQTDILIAVTSSDEVNIIACQLANILFNVSTKIARINNQSYFLNRSLFDSDKLNIDFVVSPSSEISKSVKRNISIPGALDVIPCLNNKLRIIGVICKKGAPIVDIKLKYLPTLDKDSLMAILYLKNQKGNVIFPGKNDIIHAGDEVYFICPTEKVSEVMTFFGHTFSEESNIILIGGNNICQNVVSTISNPAINIKIIEKDVELAELLSENINNIEVLNGDPLNPEILNSANISDSGIVISLTADDKINILSCLLAKKLGAKRVSAILNDSSYADLLYSLGINSILNSRASSISKILHYLKKGNIEEVTEFNNEIEVVAIEVSDNSHAIGSLSDDIISKNEIYISAIIRDDNIFIMPKKMLIASGDKILFTLTKRSLDKILKLFQEKPKYLI